MSEAAWIVLYALGALASVPFLAHAFWNGGDTPWSGMTPAGCIACAFLVCYSWPLWLVGWVAWRIAKLLEPLIFREPGEGEVDG